MWLGVVSGLLGGGAGWLTLHQVSTYGLSLGPVMPVATLNLSPDVLVGVATVATAFLAGFGVGLGPAVRCAADGLSGAINRELAVAEPRKSRFRNALVVVQMAVATTVLIGVGISIRSLSNLEHAPLGFSARNLVFDDVPDIKRLGYDARSGAAFVERLREHLIGTPGIQAVTFASSAPLLGYSSDHVLADGETAGPDGHGAETPYVVVDEHYFSTIGMRVLSGRTFDSRDRSGGTEGIVVNATLANRHWPGRNPIGQRLRIESGNRVAEVIGVVPDGKYGDVDEAPLPFMYLAMPQHYLPPFMIIARTDGPRDIVARSFSEMIGATNIMPSPIPTLADALRLTLFLPRLIMWVIVCFGVLALALAGFGLYSTIYYAVNQRSREIGIRMSLGANPVHLFVMVLRQTGGVALAGALVGLASGLALVPVVSEIFYGIRPVEPAVLAGVVLATVALAVGSTYFVIRPWARLAAIDLLRR
jgi:predicted permease